MLGGSPAIPSTWMVDRSCERWRRSTIPLPTWCQSLGPKNTAPNKSTRQLPTHQPCSRRVATMSIDSTPSSSSHGRLLSCNVTTVFAVLAAMTFSASGAAPTPLYQECQSHFGLTPFMITVIFATYVLCLLLTLLTVGSLSDFLGRRPAILNAFVHDGRFRRRDYPGRRHGKPCRKALHSARDDQGGPWKCVNDALFIE